MSVNQVESTSERRDPVQQSGGCSGSSLSSAEGRHWRSQSPGYTGYSSSSSSSSGSVHSAEDDDCVIIKTVIYKQPTMGRGIPVMLEPTKRIIRRPVLKLHKLPSAAEEEKLKEDLAKDTTLTSNVQTTVPLSKTEEKQRRFSRRLRKMKQRSGVASHDLQKNQSNEVLAPPKKKMKKTNSNSSGNSSSSGGDSTGSSSGSEKEALPSPRKPSPHRVSTRSTTRRMWTVGCVYRAPSPEHTLPRRYWPVEGMHERPVWPDPRYEIPQPPQVDATELRRALHQSFHCVVAYGVQLSSRIVRKNISTPQQDCESPKCPVKLFLENVEDEKLKENSTEGQLLDKLNFQNTKENFSNFFENVGTSPSHCSDVAPEAFSLGDTGQSEEARVTSSCCSPDGRGDNLGRMNIVPSARSIDIQNGFDVSENSLCFNEGEENKALRFLSPTRQSLPTSDQEAEADGLHNVKNATTNDVNEVMEPSCVHSNRPAVGTRISNKENQRKEGVAELNFKDKKSPEVMKVLEQIIQLTPTLGLRSPVSQSSPNLQNVMDLIYYTAVLYCIVCCVSPRALARYLDASSVTGFLEFLPDDLVRK